MNEQFIQPSPLIIGYTIIFILASMAIGFYARRYAKTTEQFFGGTKSFSGTTIGLASMAAVMGSFGFISGPGLVYKFGISSIWMIIACGPGFAYGYWLIGKRMRGMAEVSNIATLPDIAYIRFNSQAVRGILAAGLFAGAMAYLFTQVRVGALLMNQMLGVSDEWGLFIIFGTIIAYMFVSGMSGSILTDAFQGIVILVAAVAVIIGFFILTGGNLTPIQNSANFGPAFIDGFGTMPMQLLLVYSLTYFIGVMGQPALLTKMYAAKSHRDLKKAGIIGGVSFGAASIVWILCGYGALYIVSSGLAPFLVKFDDATFLFASKLDGITQALVMVGILAAVISTISFFISLAASAITRDLFGALGHEIPRKKQILAGRIIQFFVAAFAIALGYWGNRVVAIWGTFGWGFFASVTLPIFVIGLLWKRCSTEGILSGLWFAIAINLAFPILSNFRIFKLPFPHYFLAITGSILLTIVVSFFTKTCAGENMPEALKPIFKL
jgi:Na+/proline symporter